MFAFKEKFPDWKDFPNGLRVLVVDEDTKVLNEIKCKLEGCQYVVSAFTKGEDALEALRDQQNIFHVALVEAMTGEGFKILEVARHLPTILMSNTENMAIMMQGIALGAADFLQKPLSDEKLRNIWQHVVRKALNTGDPLLMESLVPVKAAVESVFSLSPSPGRVKAEPVSSPGSDGESKSKDMEWVAGVTKSPSSGDAAVCERLPAPSTPQLEQTGRMNSQEDSVSESPGSDSFVQVKTEEVAKAGAEGLERTPSMNCLSVDSGDCSSGEKKGEGCKVNNKATSGRRKMKVDWTPELHRRFVQAVEQLGVEKAIPSRILELMGVQCLTRHNIASHLQKYRSHRRHLLAREAEAATWHHRKPIDPNVWARSRRDGTAWLAPHHTNPPPIQPRPPMGLTPIQPHPGAHCHPMGPPMHVWGHPTMDHTAAHMWQQPQMATPTTWQAPDGSYWQHPCIDAWGHPTPGPGTPCYPQPYRVPMAPMPAFASPMTTAALAADSYFADESMPIPMYPTAPDDPELTVAAGAAASSKPSDFHPPKEILDAAISEALANPWTPLPLGLKPPSMEGVMAELQRQGINTVPPPPLTS
ncbi:two-component response regulator ARR-B family [Marchantia polymorpha subsp. ruderalis]|uniref:Two-component response regulator-like APRR2 n=2 Tax=Marchantia polymorpha TaxID=3197 RepID=A0AAF6BXV7_MARPO|nr:hypothetical protein MARPO_0156s0007 [Marchantia polymorpha]BBN16841.1 hypothetical protein Mp_7g09740 [Marchantia polymorpha subsp. ruderalis]|eukprot:PTQ28705.1 hypothetical protein MARPO_0156s0007 [Marchantia polymorpha]